MLAHSALFCAECFKYSFLRIGFYGDTQLVLSFGTCFPALKQNYNLSAFSVFL